MENPNPYRGTVKIQLDPADQERILRLSFSALVEYEQLTGKMFDLQTIFELGPKAICTLMFVGLKNDDPTLTIEKVSDLLGPWNNTLVSRAILDSVWGGSVPDEVMKKAEEESAKNAQRTEPGPSQDVSNAPSDSK